MLCPGLAKKIQI